ncbi:hypothetical protein BU25DRAFT_415249 [Macroventuria anomochaeta]|uniref:Uncharacterized protein n=1 Tax=Macroventuria anomochaeta TaxID=301207 RepID=A0ACB6RLB8_9PLEO|nr:uncharacterized protein BU25DRAFT_415249 [Macroventuria anomochaeta]KAF2622528.1 hypothetical protein BU25DRAFT_415249 [Macroventuria anomochaeta]
MDPATACAEPDGFLLAPLPSRKRLWDAPDEQSWMVEKSLDGCFPSVFGVLTSGQMVKLREHQVILEDGGGSIQGVGAEESAANWQEWCSGMDGLGALVTLARSLAAV